jgi:uncharacterized protein (DUF58 family)
MRPTWRVAGAVVLFIVLEWYGATSEVSWLFLLAAWIAAMVGVAAFYAWRSRRGVTLRLEVDSVDPSPTSPALDLPDHAVRNGPWPAPVFEGDSFELGIHLGTDRKEAGPVWVSGKVANLDVAVGAAVVRRQGWHGRRMMRNLRRMTVGAAGWKVHTGDPMGFFQGESASADAEVAVVYPRFTSLAASRQTRELEATAAAPRAGAGTELFGVREFTPGDSLRRIHWRSSARHARLVVREHEPPGVETLAIYVDPSPKTADAADQVARLAASEAWDCIRNGGRVALWAPGLRPSGVAEGRDLWAVLDWLARYPGQAGDDPPPAAAEAVAITAGADPRLAEALGGARRHGARTRAWVIGDAELDTEFGDGVDVQRTGTRWPL